MCEKTDTTKEVIVVEEPVQVVPAIPAVPDIPETSVKDFPLCLLEKKSYTGIKGLVGIFFWISLIYFGYGIVHFFMWENTFWGIVWNIFSKPIYLIYHVCVFSFMYCLTWATFDSSSFKKSFIRILLVVASIIYIISPVDAVPDFTPIVGQADDLVALIVGILNAIALFKSKQKNNN